MEFVSHSKKCLTKYQLDKTYIGPPTVTVDRGDIKNIANAIDPVNEATNIRLKTNFRQLQIQNKVNNFQAVTSKRATQYRQKKIKVTAIEYEPPRLSFEKALEEAENHSRIFAERMIS